MASINNPRLAWLNIKELIYNKNSSSINCMPIEMNHRNKVFKIPLKIGTILNNYFGIIGSELGFDNRIDVDNITIHGEAAVVLHI